MLKVLGCDYFRLTRALNTEFIVIGVVAGVIAAAAATLTGWLLATRVLELEYVPQLSVVIISIVVSIVLVWAVSRSGVRSALLAPPQPTLRSP